MLRKTPLIYACVVDDQLCCIRGRWKRNLAWKLACTRFGRQCLVLLSCLKQRKCMHSLFGVEGFESHLESQFTSVIGSFRVQIASPSSSPLEGEKQASERARVLRTLSSTKSLFYSSFNQF